MTKEELLQELSLKMSTGEIHTDEVASLISMPPKAVMENETHVKNSGSLTVTKTMYVVGGIIVLIGIFFFVSTIWDSIGSLGRVSVTLGLGLLLTIIGSILYSKNQEGDYNIGSIFHLIGGILIPGGALVTLSELHIDTATSGPSAISFAIIFIFYFLLNIRQKSPILTFFTISNGTAFIYSVFQAITQGTYWDNWGNMYSYLTMVMGVSYLLLAYGFRNGWNRKLCSVLYFFGSFFLLGAAFSKIFNSGIWQLIYVFLVIGGLVLSARLKSGAMLVISTLFLIAYVSYITGKYFANSIGWPVALILLGFIFIGLGYISININKRYIKN